MIGNCMGGDRIDILRSFLLKEGMKEKQVSECIKRYAQHKESILDSAVTFHRSSVHREAIYAQLSANRSEIDQTVDEIVWSYYEALLSFKKNHNVELCEKTDTPQCAALWYVHLVNNPPFSIEDSYIDITSKEESAAISQWYRRFAFAYAYSVFCGHYENFYSTDARNLVFNPLVKYVVRHPKWNLIGMTGVFEALKCADKMLAVLAS